MRTLLILTLAMASISTIEAQQRQISYDDISAGKFRALDVAGLRSCADGEHFTTISDDAKSIVKYRYVDGSVVDTIFDNHLASPSFAITHYDLSQDENLIMLCSETTPIYRHSYKAVHWIYDRTKKTLTPLSKGGQQQAATFSPDGSRAAFVRDNNIFVVDLQTKNETRITADGLAGNIINGVCDWVYEEEFGFERAYQWSPASDAIAYYRFDESRVPSYVMPTYKGQTDPDNVTFKYPKAGQTNSAISIRVYNLKSATHSLVDIGRETDQYIPRIEWTGRKDELVVHRVNRLQNRYDMLLFDLTRNSMLNLYSEQSERYVDRIDDNKVFFIADGNRFLVRSEVDGWAHIYMYDMNGKFIRQITKGQWEVTSIDAVDLRNRRVYYTSTKDSELGRQPYCLRYGSRDGRSSHSALNAADHRDGTYRVNFSKGAKYYIQSYSNSTQPTVVTLHRASDNKLLRTLQDNSALRDTLAAFDMPTKRFIKLLAADSVTQLNGYLLLPPDFDSTKTYPLLMTQYSGPGSQEVADKWGLGWEAALLREGFLVACVDGRGTGFRGYDFRSCTYRQLGGPETEDQIAAAKQLGAMAFIDPSRIGIYGWSYGGFMSLNCILKGSDIFSVAIAVAPVTTWRYYDTIYTEIYNGLPSDNASGYDDNSPINFADRLKGKLLIAHGTADDNVHIQNTYDMISALNKANKEFEMLIYPDRNHSMGRDRTALMRQCIKFLKTNLEKEIAMNLLLISNSTNAGEAYLEYPKAQISKFLGSRGVRKVLFVPYAGVTVCWNDYTEKVRRRFGEIGIEVESIHTFANAAQAVRDAQAVVVGGGNSFALLKWMQDMGVVGAIRDAVLAGIPYVGWSAGSNMCCPGLYTTNDMPVVEPQSFKALGLVGFQINPHYLDSHPDGHAGETREQRLEEFLQLNRGVWVVGLREGSMLVLEGGRLELLGGKPMRVFRYGEVPREVGGGDDLGFLVESRFGV